MGPFLTSVPKGNATHRIPFGCWSEGNDEETKQSPNMFDLQSDMLWFSDAGSGSCSKRGSLAHFMLAAIAAVLFND